MRIAIVSDIHGNRTAFEAVLADLRQTLPDLILHGGDLADGGASPIDIVDRIRDPGWPGVLGNAGEMLFCPEALSTCAQGLSAMGPLLGPIQDVANWTRQALGDDRLDWLSQLPQSWLRAPLTLVHASPTTCWRAPSPQASDEELHSVFGGLGQPVVVYGHIHTPFIRSFAGMTVANAGSVSLSYDRDPRASYLLLDETVPQIRRVEYDVEKELKTLPESGLPHADWIARMLATASFQRP